MYLSGLNIDPATPTSSRRILSSTVTIGLESTNDGESQLQRWSSLIGIVTAIIGNILISFALNIQRYAHIRLHEERTRHKERAKIAMKRAQSGYGTIGANGQNGGDQIQDQHGRERDPLRRSFHSTNSHDSDSSSCSKHDSSQVKTYLKSPYWWGGIILMTIGEAGNFLAYGFAPASIVSPLGVVALISNCVIAPIMLKESFRLRDFWGVVVAVAGAVVVVLSAKTSEKRIGPHEVWGAITNLEFEIYMAITICMIVVLMWASPKYGGKTILVDLGLVGLFGGYTALSTKGVASMLSSTLWRAFTTPVTYALIAVLVGTAVMQVRYVNRALQRFDSTQVIPVQFVMFTISVIIGSAILYRDFEKATADSVGKFIGGCLLTFFGVYLITSGRPSHDYEDEGDSDEEGEERIGLMSQEHTTEEADAPQQKEHNFSCFEQAQASPRNGDGAYDEPPRSRRSSKVNFAEQSSRPRTPKAFPSSSHSRVPLSIPPLGATEIPSKGTSNDSPNKSAEELVNPSHHGLSGSISTPFLPTGARTALGDLLKPPPPSRPSSQGNLHPISAQQLSFELDGPATPVARHSISRMMPGPFISPLSGGLSAVVADTLRRGVESPRMKQPKLGIRRSKSGSQRLAHGSSVSYYDDPEASPMNTGYQISQSFANDGGEWTGLTRSRSLSNTIGDLFRGKRQRIESRDGEDEEGAGPSGS
ncbi:magnesium transporter NIPA-domain-containing protein [Amylocarpus encephaloides]|uniref:Magnesium transporter NIPA-domain-containing protein n=1 Tax=Amylocarpus encephaloides TaxID=45428 RepID=A0A9P7YNC2_9HELO|nr:magnesium transporter NIPA-domain-containing protein [Amylocarpus encephaloides]